ncbi:MAG: polyprenyl synthetase family protein [Anaerolineales bacterium]
MRQSLLPSEDQPTVASSGRSWLSLPVLCCRAAGGDPQGAERVAAAWALLYTAAHVLDSIQDRDPPDRWRAELGDGPATNVATGLMTTAWVVLDQIDADRGSIQPLIEDFHRTVLWMASGQHLDLTLPQLTLDKVWAIAEAKSGAFFALACRSGARMAGAPDATAEDYGRYGLNLGLMVQIGDDLEDLVRSQGIPPLAVAYCLETAPPKARARLHTIMQASSPGPSAQVEAAKILAGSGARLYLETKFFQHQLFALESLDTSGAEPTARNELAALVQAMASSVELSPA